MRRNFTATGARKAFEIKQVTESFATIRDCGRSDPNPIGQYAVRYGIGYVQPTALLLAHNLTWGLGLRLGNAYYWQFDEVVIDPSGQQQLVASFAGHRATFVQPTVQANYRAQPWLALSTGLSVQGFVGAGNSRGTMDPFMGQAGLHFILPNPANEQ